MNDIWWHLQCMNSKLASTLEARIKLCQEMERVGVKEMWWKVGTSGDLPAYLHLWFMANPAPWGIALLVVGTWWQLWIARGILQGKPRTEPGHSAEPDGSPDNTLMRVRAARLRRMALRAMAREKGAQQTPPMPPSRR